MAQVRRQPANGTDISGVLRLYQNRCEAMERFVVAYRQYCWPVQSLDDLKLAPFHLLATEGKVHTNQDHVWHMETLAAICRCEPDSAGHDALQGGGSDRPGKPGRRDWLVAGTDRGVAARGWS